MRPRLRLAALGALALLLTTGCRLQVDVNVEVERDGGGAVELVLGVDADGLEKAGGDLGAVLALDDLRASGWTVEGPTEEHDGFTRVHLRKPFADPAGSAAVFEEIMGADGPFQGFAVRRDRSLTEDRWGFDGRVDFSEGLAGLGTDGVARGVDPEELDRRLADLEDELGDAFSRLIEVRVRVRLPGDVHSNATTKAANGAVWQVPFGQGAVDLAATGTARRVVPILLLGVGALVVLGLLGVLLVRLAARVTR